VDLGDPVFEGNAFDFILYLAIAENAFQGNELSFLVSFGELREIPLGCSFDRSVALCFSGIWRNRTGFLRFLHTHRASFDCYFG
jgi:hypothetical protein